MPRPKRSIGRKSRSAVAIREALKRLGKDAPAFAMDIGKQRTAVVRAKNSGAISLQEALAWETNAKSGLRTGEISSAVASDIACTSVFVGVQVGSGSDAFRDALIEAQDSGKPNAIWIAVRAAELAGQRPKD